jgi:cytochrome c2
MRLKMDIYKLQNVCSMCIKINKVGKQEIGIWRVQKRFPRYGVPIWSLWPNIRFLPSIVAEKNVTKNEHICSMCIKINSQQTGSRNLMGPKTLPTIWGTYMKLVTKYQISAINSCWEKCDEKWFMCTVLNKNDVRNITSQFVWKSFSL